MAWGREAMLTREIKRADTPDFLTPDGKPACRGEDIDPDWWFDAYAIARQICKRCPLMWDCRAWAIDTAQARGMWGALTPEERAAIRRRRGINP